MRRNDSALRSDDKTWSGLDLPAPADLEDLPQPEQSLGFRSGAIGTLLAWLFMAGVIVFAAAQARDLTFALFAVPLVSVGVGWYVLVARRRELRCEPDGLHFRLWHWHEQVIPWSDVDSVAVVEHVRLNGRSLADFYDLEIRRRSGRSVRVHGSTTDEPALHASQCVLRWRDHYVPAPDGQMPR